MLLFLVFCAVSISTRSIVVGLLLSGVSHLFRLFLGFTISNLTYFFLCFCRTLYFHFFWVLLGLVIFIIYMAVFFFCQRIAIIFFKYFPSFCNCRKKNSIRRRVLISVLFLLSPLMRSFQSHSSRFFAQVSFFMVLSALLEDSRLRQ